MLIWKELTRFGSNAVIYQSPSQPSNMLQYSITEIFPSLAGTEKNRSPRG